MSSEGQGHLSSSRLLIGLRHPDVYYDAEIRKGNLEHQSCGPLKLRATPTSLLADGQRDEGVHLFFGVTQTSCGLADPMDCPNIT